MKLSEAMRAGIARTKPTQHRAIGYDSTGGLVACALGAAWIDSLPEDIVNQVALGLSKGMLSYQAGFRSFPYNQEKVLNSAVRDIAPSLLVLLAEPVPPSLEVRDVIILLNDIYGVSREAIATALEQDGL